MGPWLHNLLAVGTPSVLAALAATAGLWKWLGQNWIEHRLEKFKAEQQKELERAKTEQQKELERLRHRLSSRISKIHEKEFEVLPKAWLMLHDTYGSVLIALGLTFKACPNFQGFTEAQFEEFLTVRPASRLSNHQKDALRKASDRQKCFSEAIAGIDFDEAEEKRRIFQNYLIENRIFMTDELRKKFGSVAECFSAALTSYSVGKDANNWEMQHSGVKQVAQLKEMIDEVEQAVQERLRYEEA
jgi:hypothetical protein